MKPMKKRLLSLLLTLVTILSLLPTSAFAASKTGSGIQITQDQAYWSTRLLANGTPYSYRPPLADGKLVYCMDSGLGYHYATKSFLDSYSWTSGSGADADAVLQSALTNSGLSEMDAMTVENVKWMMTYLNDCKDSNVGQLFMAVQTYVWENQSYKGEPGGDGDAGGYANADTYELYLSLIDNLLAKKAAEDAEFLKQIEAYKAQGIEASIVEDESAKWAVFAISSNRKNQSFFNYYGPRKLSVGEAKPDQPEQPVGGTGKITLTKTAAGTLKGLPGARYSIYFNGQIVGSDVTNESGELHIENAATGLWTFIETDAPSGFCVDPTPKSVYVDASEGDREYTVAAVNYANPFVYVHNEKDVLTLIDNLIKNTTPRNASSNDPFWEKAEIALDSALMLYLISEAPSEERNFETMLYMMNFAEVREDDDQYRSPLDMLFRALEEEQPNHVAVKQYKVFKQAAGVVCSKRLLNQAVGKSLRTHNLKPKKGAQVMRKNEKITALYERLSRDDFGKDDDQQRESNSISNQKAMLEEFAARQGFTNIVHFTDDGISGTCFDRPGFLAMMKEVEAGNVEYLCIKDMSRMGRDYLKVGQIMEILRQRGVRLIAINDGVDSARGDDDFTPFRNIMKNISHSGKVSNDFSLFGRF